MIWLLVVSLVYIISILAQIVKTLPAMLDTWVSKYH